MPSIEPPPESPLQDDIPQESETLASAPVPASAAARLLVSLAMLYTLYFTAPILVPLLSALLLSLMLAPVVRWLNAMGLPRSLAAPWPSRFG